MNIPETATGLDSHAKYPGSLELLEPNTAATSASSHFLLYDPHCGRQVSPRYYPGTAVMVCGPCSPRSVSKFGKALALLDKLFKLGSGVSAVPVRAAYYLQTPLRFFLMSVCRPELP